MPSGEHYYGKDGRKSLRRNLKEKQARDARKPSICGARRRDGKECKQVAGWGTNHIGIGPCKFHAGNLSSVRKNAIVVEAQQFMGAPKDINPLDAIMWCIRISAGEVEWLSTEIAKVPMEEWIEHAYIGKQLNVLQRARADAQDRLVRYSRDAIQLGLAERAVRLAENFGMMIARLLENIAVELKLSRAQKELWPGIVRRQLILLEGGMPPERRELIEGEIIAESEDAAAA
jgi:hypothetical protein